jgi:cytochrome d ubiquinol oxidase subunit I
VRWALTIPRLGSVIARNSLDAPVPGLDGVPPADRPPVNITHLAFQSMVVIGTLLAAAVILYWLARWRGHDLLDNRWFLRFAVIAGPLAVLCVEFGWIATEVGRQHWAVWQILRTADAASRSGGLWWSYIGVLIVYLGMTIAACLVLRSMAKRWRAGEEDLPTPYGPSRVEPVS